MIIVSYPFGLLLSLKHDAVKPTSCLSKSVAKCTSVERLLRLKYAHIETKMTRSFDGLVKAFRTTVHIEHIIFVLRTTGLVITLLFRIAPPMYYYHTSLYFRILLAEQNSLLSSPFNKKILVNFFRISTWVKSNVLILHVPLILIFPSLKHVLDLIRLYVSSTWLLRQMYPKVVECERDMQCTYRFCIVCEKRQTSR